jgi:hypothetical protein
MFVSNQSIQHESKPYARFRAFSPVVEQISRTKCNLYLRVSITHTRNKVSRIDSLYYQLPDILTWASLSCC